MFSKEIKYGHCIRWFLSSLRLGDLDTPGAKKKKQPKNWAKPGDLLPPLREVMDGAQQGESSAPAGKAGGQKGGWGRGSIRWGQVHFPSI